jgi:hypothetical protein
MRLPEPSVSPARKGWDSEPPQEPSAGGGLLLRPPPKGVSPGLSRYPVHAHRTRPQLREDPKINRQETPFKNLSNSACQAPESFISFKPIDIPSAVEFPESGKIEAERKSRRPQG